MVWKRLTVTFMEKKRRKRWEDWTESFAPTRKVSWKFVRGVFGFVFISSSLDCVGEIINKNALHWAKWECCAEAQHLPAVHFQRYFLGNRELYLVLFSKYVHARGRNQEHQICRRFFELCKLWRWPTWWSRYVNCWLTVMPLATCFWRISLIILIWNQLGWRGGNAHGRNIRGVGRGPGAMRVQMGGWG